ncbi:MAG: SUMF1/EgtB/PvdO family nonheme iron enzyme, partial [Candidatus Cloacimonetes bacterium]|nr:SUMF1/EgtB/PvdO family nonheme iron enzyme [Candidatus Cloacimonadota bacterium]
NYSPEECCSISVGKKKANELGIYDMSGNVNEWCWDWYEEDYYSKSPKVNPRGPVSGTYSIFRGGSFNDTGDYCRVFTRFAGLRDNVGNNVGLRVVRVR